MADLQPIDFGGLAEALLKRADTLVPQWLPEGELHNGRWYVGDFDGSRGKSANVNLKTGAWGDNGRPGDSGRDLISLYGRIHGLSNMAAARALMVDNGWQNVPVTPPAAKRARKSDVEWAPIHPVPDDAPPYRTQWAHYSRGVPPQHWEYRDIDGRLLGVVVRFETSDGGKDVQPISFCQGSNGRREWRYKAFAQPRPLYGLWRLKGLDLATRPRAIVVEGEKKADALYEALGRSTPVLGWPGGCKTPQLTRWGPLMGWSVLCWPDADAQRDKKTGELLVRELQPGMAAMRKVQALLAELKVPARIVDIGEPGSRPDGWDCGDAVAEGWTPEQLHAFMARLVPEPADEERPAPAPAAVSTPSPAGAVPDEVPRWREGYVLARGAIAACPANVMLLLEHHALWQGVLGFDEFAQRVVKLKAAPYDAPGSTGGEWSDIDDTLTAAWIARREHWVPTAGQVAESANAVAAANRFHPVLQYLRSLKWDGIERIDHWLADFMHVVPSDYVRLVSRYFLVGMCMRVLKPGCKFDTCLVLEGLQGRRKSSALRILAGEWFSDIELDLQNKDAMSNIRGKWLHEFGELGSLARAESSRQKSFLSRQVDEFRPTYGRREIRCPRQTAFAGSTNEWQWNKDPTGGRRFWPIDVGEEIDTDGLAAARDQLFAEAFQAALAGERFWPTGDEQRELFDPEQGARESPDAYSELLELWFDGPLVPSEFTLADACLSGLKLDAKSLTRDIQTRVGIALRKLGCERVERRNAANRFVYKRPQRNAASSQTRRPSAGIDAEVPF